ncbi:MAG TPA: TolC family protein [Candidatus Ozemobacteraceae bacterium]|nr:TolC family protein [Candidatus Ozemobacteraceae bacterium]
MTHSSHKRSIHAFFLLFLATGALVRAEDAPPGTPNHQHPASMTIPMEAVETGHGAFVAIPPELTLEDCLKLAAGNNRTVLASRARTSAGRAKANQVFRTQLPNASVSAQDTKYREPTSPTLSDRQDAQRLSLTETFQPFGRYRSQSRAANASVDAAVADERRTLVDVSFQVSKAFYDMVLADDLIRVASDSVDQRQKHRDHTQRLVDAGTAPRFDLLRAEVQLSAARPALIKAVHSRSTALADLLHLLGLDPSAQPAVVGSFPAEFPPLPLDEDRAIQLACEQRPDLAAAMASEEAARHQVNVARQALQPSVQLNGTYERTRGARAPIGSYRDNWLTTVGLIYPVFDSGLSQAQRDEAKAAYEQARLSTENILSTLRVDIRKAIAGVKEAEEVFASQEKNVEQAQEALSIAQVAYDTGAKTALDVLDSEVALTQARTLRAQALHQRAVAMAQLTRAIGLLPEPLRNAAR